MMDQASWCARAPGTSSRQGHRALFEQACADAAEHIVRVWRSRMTLSMP